MPIKTLPLFRAEVVRSHLGAFTIPPSALEARARLADWVTLLESAHGKQLNEKELLPDFLTDLFGQVLRRQCRRAVPGGMSGLAREYLSLPEPVDQFIGPTIEPRKDDRELQMNSERPIRP